MIRLNLFDRFGFLQFSQFILVGAINTLIDGGLYLALTRSTEIEPLTASLLSFFAGGMNSFFMNKYWTFENTAARAEALRQLTKFIIVSMVILSLHQFSLLLLHHKLGFHDVIAKGCGIGTGVIVGFLLNKYWVFRWAPLTR